MRGVQSCMPSSVPWFKGNIRDVKLMYNIHAHEQTYTIHCINTYTRAHAHTRAHILQKYSLQLIYIHMYYLSSLQYQTW